MSAPRYLKMAVVGIPVYAAAAFGAYIAFKKPVPESQQARTAGVHDPFVTPGAATNRAVYDKSAPQYDDAVGWDEVAMGLLLLRRWLLRSADGRTLEVACGTGRNIPYYPDEAKPLVLSDASRGMLAQTKAKATARWGEGGLGVPNSGHGGTAPPRWTLAHSTAESPPFAEGSFDTVVSTFSLCSVDDPYAALRGMARVCSPSGRILLLEHGRSGSWEFVNKWLDESAPAHACKWGCWWNRDLGGLLQRAEADGVLHIHKTWSTHFGTTLWVEASPGPAMQQPHSEAVQEG